MQPVDYNAGVVAAVSDVFEDATVDQCQEVARKLADYLLAASWAPRGVRHTVFGVDLPESS